VQLREDVRFAKRFTRQLFRHTQQQQPQRLTAAPTAAATSAAPEATVISDPPTKGDADFVKYHGVEEEVEFAQDEIKDEAMEEVWNEAQLIPFARTSSRTCASVRRSGWRQTRVVRWIE